MVLIAFISLIGLIIIHEFGHFLLAKKFGVKVEEFGVGLPPRLIGKKIGQTIYSLNLLPFGAFVKLYGEEDREKKEYRASPRECFWAKPVWQRALIVLGGVVSFWIISTILLSIVLGLGVPTAVRDQENHTLINPKVQIVAVAPDSPAEVAGLRPGDTIRKLKIRNSKFEIQKVKKVQQLTQKYKGQEVILTIERGKEIFDVSLVPRISPPKGEGAMGVALVRTAIKKYPWYIAPFQGIKTCANLTVGIVKGWGKVIGKVLAGEPTGAQLMGPVGIFSLLSKAMAQGVSYFLQFIAIIAIYIALFNILPIPAVDGGKLLFLGIEAVRRKPISSKIEQQITAIFFALLIALMIWVTIQDIARLF